MDKPKFIKRILSDNPIQDYLSVMGHEPASQYGSRVKYFCPIHGPEKEPSFYVFTDKEYENFHCFSCKSHGDIINLTMKLENLSLKQAIHKFAKEGDFERDYFKEIEEEVESLYDIYEHSDGGNIGYWAYQISQNVYTYLNDVNFDPLELSFMENIFKKVDNIIHAMDEDKLVKIYQFLVDEGIPSRRKHFDERKRKELKNKYKKRYDN